MTGPFDAENIDVNTNVSLATELDPRAMTVEAVGMGIAVVIPGATNVSLLAPVGAIGFESTR